MEIIPYKTEYKAQVIALLEMNTPKYFSAEEANDLIHYLDHEIEAYYVVKEDNKIIGAGGINYFLDEDLARIAWDFIDPNYQGKGIGRQLLQHRINAIKTANKVSKVIVRTSQLVYPFYEKSGFTLKEVKKDFWYVGYDLYLLEMEL